MGIATRNFVTSNSPRQNRKYSIVIPAAGSGHRMKKYGAKSLIKVNGADSIIDRQLKLIYETFRWCEIILITGFQHDKIERTVPSKIKLVHNDYYEDTNVLHSISIGLDKCTTEHVIILYGDLVFNKHAINVPFDQESAVVIADTMKKEEIGCNIDQNYLQQMFYGIQNKWAQITFLKGRELEIFTEFAKNENNHMKYGFEAINNIIENKGSIRTIKPKKAKVIDIDSSLDLKEIGNII